MGFFFIFYANVFSQDSKLADSLETVYVSGAYKEQDKLKILEGLAIHHNNPEKKLIFSVELLETARALDSTDYFFNGLLYKGNALKRKGDYSKAMESYFQAAEIADKEAINRNRGKIYDAMANVYSKTGNYEKAIDHYKKSIEILKEENDSFNIGIGLYNTGDAYYNWEKYDSAVVYFNKSNRIFKNINYILGIAHNLGSIGMIYAKQGKYDLAKKNINEAILLCEEEAVYFAIPEFMISMCDIYVDQGDLTTAFSCAQKSLEMALKYGQKKEVSEANRRLSDISGGLGNYQLSNTYLKAHYNYSDSVKNIESVQQLANLQTGYEVSQKQMEVDLLEKESEIQLLKVRRQRNLNIASGIAVVFILIFAIGLYRRYRFTKKTNRIIEEEKNRSDNLLLNILPEETALELKQKGKVKAKKFESVTVLFTDFEGFTQYSQNLTPEELVESVDFYYSKFDEIMEKYDLEKIKTLGDSYMCAGGLHFHSDDHAIKMIEAAFDIKEFVNQAKNSKGADQTRFDIRIGVNTGPVVAGIVGTKKFAYDIWGDTVNVASRMETTSEPGKINISENTYDLIKEDYDCSYRGELFVKNKGMMKMYFVNGELVC